MSAQSGSNFALVDVTSLWLVSFSTVKVLEVPEISEISLWLLPGSMVPENVGHRGWALVNLKAPGINICRVQRKPNFGLANYGLLA